MNINDYHAKPGKSIGEHNDDLLKALDCMEDLGYLPSKHIYDLVKMACTYHDYGKMNPRFQERIHSERKRFNENTEVAHNVLSLYFLPEEIFENAEDYYKVAHAVLNHHDYCDALEILQNNDKKELIKELLKEFSNDIQKIGRRKVDSIFESVEDREAILIKGFLHKCDYSASAGIQVEYPNDFLVDQLENLGYKWNDLQQFCMENTNKNIIAIAQTGKGKTEGGLHWIGNRKGFFILPIRTAINAIYDRVRKGILQGEKIEERVALLHSGAMEYYQENIYSKEKTFSLELDLADYYDRGRKLSIPLTICTMDQLFDFVFKYNGYEMKMATLSYARVVLDEIQMYTPDLLAYLICGIKKISQFGGKVAIVTATLPPFVKSEIIKALGAEVEEGIFIDDSKRHHVKVYENQLDAKIIYDKFKSNREQGRGNKLLIVCNTIKKAQEIYHDLKQEADQGVAIDLLHARFLKDDRAKKEKDILAFAKPPESKADLECKSGIWISTSIVEASLDIDFDYLFTELCDLNSLFQRFGRCNRKGFKPVTDPNCHVFTKINMGKNLDETLITLSKEELRNADGIIDEKQKIEMIDRCFTTEKVCESKYFIEYNRIKKQIEEIAAYEARRSEIDLRNIMSTNIIPAPVYKENAVHIQEVLEQLEIEENTMTRAKLRESIRGFTVAIPSYIVKGRSKYIETTLSLSRYEKIPVFVCEYDQKLGFREIDYTTFIKETNLL